MTLDIILFRKETSKLYKLLHTFALFSFCLLLPSLTNKWPNTTLSMSDEGAIEYILRAKTWLDGFDSVFWKNSIEFLLVVFCCFFSRLKKIIRTGPNTLLYKHW